MSCYYCHKAHWNIDDVGLCTACSKLVCGPPPRRSDGEFHADECRCGCGKLICRVHMLGHASDAHGSDPAKCFPRFGFASGVAALRAAGPLLASVRPPELTIGDSEIQALSRLLVSIVPSATVLARVLPPAPSLSWTWDHESLADTGEVLISFERPFFTRRMVTGIFALAERTAIRCWLQPGGHPHLQLEEALGRNAQLTPKERISFEQLQQLAGPVFDVAVSRTSLNLALTGFVPGASDYARAMELTAAIRDLELPEEPEQVAEWIYWTDRGSAREPAEAGVGSAGGAAAEPVESDTE